MDTFTSAPLGNAAPIQTTIIDRPWQVVQGGMVIGHHQNKRTAEATSAQYPGSTVRYAGLKPKTCDYPGCTGEPSGMSKYCRACEDVVFS
jgi:hypothetical protein